VIRSTLSRLVPAAALALAAPAAAPATAAAAEGYLRSPDLHGDRVVFTAEDDLWLAPAAGGEARRLTSHVGVESRAAFSPDGSWIAFTGQYDGNADVFVVPAGGGEPRRLTWHPAGDLVVGWTPDGERVTFASGREHPNGHPELFTVPAAGGDAAKLPLGWATWLDVEPGTGRYALTRTNGGGTWKRYRGGTAQTVWVGHPDRADYREVTRFDGMSAFPMWHGGRIYFLSDAGGTANLWSMDPDGSGLVRHTDLGRWDARTPAMAPDGRIVFALAGGLRLFDPRTGAVRALDVRLPSDRVLTRARTPDAARYITAVDLSPDGGRLAVTARGEIFSVPVEDGVTLPVTRGSGARESAASFDPEGERLIYLTDEPHEEEIRSIDAWGRGEPRRIRPAAARWHFPPRISPDGERIAYADSTQTLYTVPVAGGEPTVVDRARQAPITEYAWSPDGRWLAYAKTGAANYSSIFLHDTRSGENHRVTGDDTHDYTPAWDPEGRYLYFLSDRFTNPLLGSRDLEHVDIEPTRPYLALLRPDVENPFADRAGLPPDDEEKGEQKDGDEDEDGDEDGKKDEKNAETGDSGDGGGKGGEDDAGVDGDEAPEPVEIELAGLGDRIVELPVEPGQYSDLAATAGKVFYLSHPLVGMAEWGPLFGGEGAPQASLVAFDLETEKAETWVEGAGNGGSLLGGAGWSGLIVRGGKVVLAKGPGKLLVFDAAAKPGDLAEAEVDLGGVVVEVEPAEEWAQIFHESWRQMRDYYWDEGLGGVDWPAVRDQYAALLPRLATRSDLQDLIAEMIGELSTSHTYVFGGDAGKEVPSRPTGLLGADLVREGDAFRVARIYRGAPADGERAPLLEPGVGIAEGDYVLAVNHRPFRDRQPFHAHLEGLAGKPVVLTVNRTPSAAGARDRVVVPLASEQGVRYADWVRRNRERVAEATGGRIGYVHIPDMMAAGMIEFNTWFYPQLDKEGMVVDVRWNGGGFVSQMILERLRRPLISLGRSRGGRIQTYPYRTLNGPFVVLTNQQAGSDGDILPAAIQLEGLAPVIGMRSWGGVVGISSLRPLVDGGILTQPESAWWDPEGGWAIENRGVEPDIVVENRPQDLARGEDPQLERAIAEVLRLHAAEPPVRPEYGPVRARTRDAHRGELERLLGTAH
jgi:tricorn protease